MVESGDISVDFSVDELVVLAQLLGYEPLPGLGREPFGEISDAEREAALGAARRSLIARRVVSLSGEAVEVLPAVAAVIEIAAAPGILGRAQFESRGSVETRFYGSRPDATVEHAPLEGSVHRLTPFPTDELLTRVLDFCRLEQRPEIEAPPFTVSFGELQACGERVAAGDSESARVLLSGAGAPTDSAAAFVQAIGTKCHLARVTFLYRLDDNRLAGGELTWVDGGEHGLWLTPTPDADDAIGSKSEGAYTALLDEPVMVTPTSASAIAAELLSYLPGDDAIGDD